MKPWIIAGVLIAVAGLGACKKKEGAWASLGGDSHHGRYLGVGIYRPENAWARMVAAQPAKETAAARPADDQAIIVVVDSDTGEVRACGDLTGYCIGMNPWNKALAKTQIAPIDLTEHAKPPASGSDTAEAKAAPAAH